MTDREYVIKYRAAPSWITRFFWLCSIAAIFLTLYATQNFVEYGVFFLAICPIFIAMAILMHQNSILLRADGLHFPFPMMPNLLFRLSRAWSDIGAVMIQDKDGPGSFEHTDLDAKELVIHFNSGGHASLDLSGMSFPDLENFFLANKIWGSTAVFAPELIELKRKLFDNPHQHKQISFTSLWDAEMQQHFTTTNFAPLERGAQLLNGKFKIVSQLTAGGLSAIYLAEKTDTKETFVLKEAVVPPFAEEKLAEKARTLFAREARLLMGLQHPRIAKVLDHFVENKRDYLVLQYIPGQSLRQIVTIDGAQSESHVVDWAFEIASILDYLHNQQPPIIHRDVSPDNLLLRTDNTVHMIDFGAASEFLGTATGTLIGKQCYISPEQFKGKAQPLSDIYSLGATMHFLLTGVEPEALSVSRPAQVRPELSREIDELVAKCTALKENDRPASAHELVNLLLKLRTDTGANESRLARHRSQ